jgi:hypothetical protein
MSNPTKGDAMYRTLLGLIGAAALVIGATAGSASAEPLPNCYGDQVAGFATNYGGISNAAGAFGVTIPEGHNILLSVVCGRTNGVVPIP